jgi:hypothetical protein
MIFSLKLVTLSKPVISFNGYKNKKNEKICKPDQKTYFDKLVING